MVVPQSFGRWLRELRRSRDLTQDELARQVGCALITIKKIEADDRRPSRQIAERMLRVLAIPPEEQSMFMQRARYTSLADARLAPSLPATPIALDLDALPGQTLKGYQLQACLGRGGFGAVFRATQPGVGREVAIKVILPQFANHPDFIRRFEMEAQTVARLEHPHIVPLYDYWREPGGAYLVMRYLRGGTLQALLEHGPLTLPVVVRLLEQVGAALAAAHRQGIVHRDLKPANILLDADANFYLADFGIAKDRENAGLANLAHTGALVGSSAYLSPEQIRTEPITPRTDIYSLGIVLYEALVGVKPFQGSTPVELMQQHLSIPLPPLRERRIDVPSRLEVVLQRATAKNPADRYGDAASLVSDALAALGVQPQMAEQRADATMAPLLAAAPPTIALDLPDQDNPYKGLRAFSEADAADFFGREVLIAQLLERLAEESVIPDSLSVAGDGRRQATDQGPWITGQSRFLAVVGPSGSGKSSVVEAGLIPALRCGALPGSEQWFIAQLVPGTHPLDELELALLRLATTQPHGLREQIERDERGLARAARLVLPDDGESELLLVIDQFEELFTLVEDERARAHFLNNLVAAVRDACSRVRVIVTLRADFYDRPLRYAALGELVQARTEVVLPLNGAELEQAIVGPAARVGLALEPGLVQLISRDVGEQPGALPLMEYALTELFERREGRALKLTAYEAIGGVMGALTRRADTLYAGLDEPEQEAARQLFLRLVTLGEGVEDTRRRVRRSELESVVGGWLSLAADGRQPAPGQRQPIVDRVIDLYGRYRLLTFDRDPITREPTVEVAHEALIGEWERLRIWLDESRDDLRVQRRLAAVAAEWMARHQDLSFLAHGAQLAQFAALMETGTLSTLRLRSGQAGPGHGLTLNAQEIAYIKASLAEQDRLELAERERQARELALARESAIAQRSAARRLRYLVGALALFLIVAVGLAALAFNRQIEAQANFRRSEAQRLAAEANRLLVERQNSELAALLSIRSMQLQYTPQGDEALAGAAQRDLPRRLFKISTGALGAIALSPDGSQMLLSSGDGTARLWDIQAGVEQRRFSEHGSNESGVAFSPDGTKIVSGGFEGIAFLYDARTGAELHQLHGPMRTLYTTVFSPDGASVLIGDDTGAQLWDVQTGTMIRRFEQATIAFVVAFSPDGHTVLTGGGDGKARLWERETGQLLRVFAGHSNAVTSVAFSSDGRYILTGSQDKTAWLWDAHTGSKLHVFTGHTNYVVAVAFSPDGRTVATSSWDGTARLWDMQSGVELHRFAGHSGIVTGIAFSPDGASLFTSSTDGTVRVWDVHGSGELPVFAGHTGTVQSVAFSPDGKEVLTGSADTTARLWDARTGQALRTLAGHSDQVWTVAYSPDGRYLLTGSSDQTAKLWEAKSGKQVRSLIGQAMNSSAFSPDGKSIVTGGSADNAAWLWDAQTGTIIRKFIGHARVVSSVAFSPDGSYVLTSSDDGTARLWSTQTGATFLVLTGHTDSVWWVAYSRDGKCLLTGSFDRTARLWDATSGALIRSFIGHTGPVVGVAFSPDGRYVLTGSLDKTARLWDAQTGLELRRFAGSNGEIGQGGAVAFSPDGRFVLTGSADGTARLWDVDYHDTIRYLCGHLLRDLTDDERAQYSINDSTPTCT